jgi:hypothetical protein
VLRPRTTLIYFSVPKCNIKFNECSAVNHKSKLWFGVVGFCVLISTTLQDSYKETSDSEIKLVLSGMQQIKLRG